MLPLWARRGNVAAPQAAELIIAYVAALAHYRSIAPAAFSVAEGSIGRVTPIPETGPPNGRENAITREKSRCVY